MQLAPVAAPPKPEAAVSAAQRCVANTVGKVVMTFAVDPVPAALGLTLVFGPETAGRFVVVVA
jgi:hypothetical protein